jgi:adenylate cyclase
MSNQEIEKKFLSAGFPSEKASDSRHIEQGYLAVGSGYNFLPLSVRLRRIDGEASFLTVKAGSGVARTEVELPLTPSQFEALWPLTEGHRLTKTRYRVPLFGGAVAEVDTYEGSLKGLETVEVEFSSEAQAKAFRQPPWFGKEVTEDPRYQNSALAISGIPSPKISQAKALARFSRYSADSGSGSGRKRVQKPAKQRNCMAKDL